MAGASKTTVSRAQSGSKSIDTKPTSRCCIVAPCERGPIGGIGVSPPPLTGIADFERVYGNPTLNTQDTYLQVKAMFEEAAANGGGVTAYVIRVVHCTDPTDPTTKTSAAGTVALKTSSVAATSGVLQSAAGPFILAAGDTLVFVIDGGSNQTFTIAATQAVLTSGSAGPYALADGQTLTGSTDGLAWPSKVFHTSEFGSIGAATAGEVVASLNAFFAANGIGSVASVSTNEVRITSNRKGTGSGENVTGGTANTALGFSTTPVAGTGNVSNVLAVTAAELATIIAGITGSTVTVIASALNVRSNTTGGSSSVQLLNTSTTTAKLGLDNAIHAGLTTGTQNTLTVAGKTDGTYANALSPKITAASNGKADHFNLYVLRGGVAAETFTNVNMTPTSPNYAPTRINVGSGTQVASNLIAVTDLASTVPSPGNLPAVGTFGPLTGGNDGLVSLADADWTGGTSQNGAVGMRALNVIAPGFMLLCPGRATAAVHNGMSTYCEGDRGGLCSFIPDTPANLTGDALVTYVTQTALLTELSELGFMTWPRVQVDNPNTTVFGTAPTIICGPSGGYAGLCFRMAQSKDGGAFEQPASGEKGTLVTVRGLETDEVKDINVRGRVFDALVNPIMIADGATPWVDGARTLKDSGAFPSVGESLGVLFLQIAIGTAIDPKRNQDIRPRLLNEIYQPVTTFMSRLTAKGCFASSDNKTAWFFDIGKALNTAADADAKTVNGRLGVATAKPAEFINILISPISISAAA